MNTRNRNRNRKLKQELASLGNAGLAYTYKEVTESMITQGKIIIMGLDTVHADKQIIQAYQATRKGGIPAIKLN